VAKLSRIEKSKKEKLMRNLNNQTIKLFLISQTTKENCLNNFGHLIISKDSRISGKALSYIQNDFKKFRESDDDGEVEPTVEGQEVKKYIEYMSFEHICKLAEDCIPDSPYRAQLRTTHKQMNTYIAALESLLLESTAKELIHSHKMGADAAMVGAQIELTKIKQMFAPRTTVDLKENSDLNG